MMAKGRSLPLSIGLLINSISYDSWVSCGNLFYTEIHCNELKILRIASGPKYSRIEFLELFVESQ